MWRAGPEAARTSDGNRLLLEAVASAAGYGNDHGAFGMGGRHLLAAARWASARAHGCAGWCAPKPHAVPD
eukprot:4250772-Prymnesium_polylepis.1